MGKYRKLIAAIIGLVILLGLNYFEFVVPGINELVMQLIVGALTAFSVYQTPNNLV